MIFSLPWKSWDIRSLSWAQLSRGNEDYVSTLQLNESPTWFHPASPIPCSPPTSPQYSPSPCSDVGYCLERPSTLSFQVTTPLFTIYFCLSDTGIDNSLCVLAQGFYFSWCTDSSSLPLWHKPFQGLCPLLRTFLLGQWDNLLSKYLFNVGQSYDSLFPECIQFKTPIFLSMNNSRQAICLWDKVVIW